MAQWTLILNWRGAKPQAFFYYTRTFNLLVYSLKHIDSSGSTKVGSLVICPSVQCILVLELVYTRTVYSYS